MIASRVFRLKSTGAAFYRYKSTKANDGNPLIYVKEISKDEIQNIRGSIGSGEHFRGIQRISERTEHDSGGILGHGGRNSGAEESGRTLLETTGGKLSDAENVDNDGAVRHSIGGRQGNTQVLEGFQTAEI